MKMNNIYRPFGSVVQRSSESSPDSPSGSSSPDNSSGFIRTTENLTRRTPNIGVNNDYSGGDNSFPSDFGVASGESDSIAEGSALISKESVERELG